MALITNTAPIRIPYTRPSLPPLADMQRSLGPIWESGHVTNFGPVQRRFELALRGNIANSFIATVANGWSALRLALASLHLEGEVVVSGFTHPATAQAAASVGLQPVPADINPSDLNISVASVSQSITERTSAIVATHVFGNAADVSGLEVVARRHGLKLVFDAAAGVGCRYKGRLLGEFGHASAFSFHATKILSSIEGGAVTSGDSSLIDEVRQLSNFGIQDGVPSLLGMNAKMSEFAAAVGLESVAVLDGEIASRAVVRSIYQDHLRDEPAVEFVTCRSDATGNNSTVAIRIHVPSTEHANPAEDVAAHLRSHGIESRTYFAGRYAVGLQTDRLPQVAAASREILCLPVWGAMPESDVAAVCSHLKQALRRVEAAHHA